MEMYQEMHMWDEAIEVAEAKVKLYITLSVLRDSHLIRLYVYFRI